MRTITVKTAEEFKRDYGHNWKHKKFKVHDISAHDATVQVHPAMCGMILELEEHEYEYYKEHGVLRWSDEDKFFGIAYITKEMCIGTGKYENSVIVHDIYAAKHELIRVRTSATYRIKEEIIKERMNLVKLKC